MTKKCRHTNQHIHTNIDAKPLKNVGENVEMYFRYLQTVYGDNSIARLLLPLFQHAQQCQQSRTVGWKNAVTWPRTKLKVAYAHQLFASSLMTAAPLLSKLTTQNYITYILYYNIN